MQLKSGTVITARGLLFDMDGTLVDSTAAVERIWGRWARAHGVNFKDFAHRMHGRRAIEIMRELAPVGVDPEDEVRQIDEDELNETEGIVPIPGALELIAALPPGSWALVTSARTELAHARMAAAGLPMPGTIVTSSNVSLGKPHPECYLHALAKLGCRAGDAVVFEDAPAGLAAGRAAGCRTIALATTTPAERLDHEEWLSDLSYVSVEDVLKDGTLRLRVG